MHLIGVACCPWLEACFNLFHRSEHNNILPYDRTFLVTGTQGVSSGLLLPGKTLHEIYMDDKLDET